MKTFKLIALHLEVSDDSFMDFDLTEGLIINKENDQGHWLIEALLTQDSFTLFEEALEQLPPRLTVQCIITKPDNNPAYFNVEVQNIRQINQHVSVLLQGQLCNQRPFRIDSILDKLIDQGLEGDQLKKAFKEKLKVKQ